jgi:hypothetical protein
VRELQQHRAILKGAVPVAEAFDNAVSDPASKSKFIMGLYTASSGLTPHGLLTPPVCGQFAEAAGLAAWLPAESVITERQQALARMRLEDEQRRLGPVQAAAGPPQGDAAAKAPAAAPNSAGPWPEWRPLFVGFAAGLIVATLAALQFLEWRRRRRAAAAPAGAPTLPPTEFSPPRRTEPAVHDAGAIRTDAPSAPDRVEGAP